MHRPNSIITITTDFGLKDHYVSAMKAVILGINPDARLIDISHEIPPQDIMAGAWVLKNTAFLYPTGTIHLVVIDPGVGSSRKPIICKLNGHYFVGPDNGLFSLLAEEFPIEVYEISNKQLRRESVANTFHGRDIFAPAAAHLSNGENPVSFGELLQDIVRYRWATPISDDEGIQGWIVHIDQYGNLITNIPAEMLDGCKNHEFRIYAGTTILNSIVTTFSDVEDGEAAAYIGSSDMLEISVNKGNAGQLLNIHKGAPVSVVFKNNDANAS
jgi:S-adenosylmethionine hydrolase